MTFCDIFQCHFIFSDTLSSGTAKENTLIALSDGHMAIKSGTSEPSD